MQSAPTTNGNPRVIGEAGGKFDFAAFAVVDPFELGSGQTERIGAGERDCKSALIRLTKWRVVIDVRQKEHRP